MEPSNTTAVGAFLLEAYFHGTFCICLPIWALLNSSNVVYKGIYLIIFSCTMYFTWNRGHSSNARRSIIIVGFSLCVIFLLSTAHMALSLCRLFLNVVTAPSMSGPYEFLRGNALALSIASKTTWVIIMLLSDTLVVRTTKVAIHTLSWCPYQNNHRYGGVGYYGSERFG
jgi:hypothetical protein